MAESKHEHRRDPADPGPEHRHESREAAPEPGAQCGKCLHYWEGSADAGGDRCDAFHVGIPAEIWAGTFDHSNAYQGDLGILYAPGGPRPASSWTPASPPSPPPPSPPPPPGVRK